jgi:hypothetical protein
MEPLMRHGSSGLLPTLAHPSPQVALPVQPEVLTGVIHRHRHGYGLSRLLQPLFGWVAAHVPNPCAMAHYRGRMFNCGASSPLHFRTTPYNRTIGTIRFVWNTIWLPMLREAQRARGSQALTADPWTAFPDAPAPVPPVPGAGFHTDTINHAGEYERLRCIPQ